MKNIVMMAAAAALVSGAAAADDYERSINALKHHMLDNRIGSSADQTLQVRNAIGDWEDYLLVFGNANDAVACQQIAAVLPLLVDETRCVRAN